MSSRSIDAMDDAAQWAVVEPDGSTPSGELVVATETGTVGYGSDRKSLRITTTQDADGHAMRRTRAPIDLAADRELRLSIRAGKTMPAGRPVLPLALRLGSAARPIGHPANTWHRYLPIYTSGEWETVSLSLDDLDLSGPLTQLELRCVAGGRAFEAYVDDLIAVRPQPFADADRGLVSRLNGIQLGGNPVPVAVRAANQSVPGGPAVDIVQFDVAYARHRMSDVARPRDHTDSGHRLVRPGESYDVDYAVTPVAANRAEQSALLEAIVDRLAPVDELIVDGGSLPVEIVPVSGVDRIARDLGAGPVLLYRVGVRRSPAADLTVPTVRNVSVEAEQWEIR